MGSFRTLSELCEEWQLQDGSRGRFQTQLQHWLPQYKAAAAIRCAAIAKASPVDFKTYKVPKNENFFGSEFEFCTISLLVIPK